MNRPELLPDAVDLSMDAAIEAACRTVAPSWPLDRLIAVNPYWGWIDRPMEEVAARLAELCGSTMHLPREFYLSAWQKSRFSRDDVVQALDEAGSHTEPDAVIATMTGPEQVRSALPLLSDVLDARRDLTREPSWRSTITHQVSQFCAAYFDAGQADWRPANSLGLYAGWRHAVTQDHSVSLLMKAPEVRQRAQSLPRDARQAIIFALSNLAVPEHSRVDLMCAILLRINGWAAWCAYQRWQARLDGKDDAHIVDLLAIRLAWECLIDDGSEVAPSLTVRWQQAWQSQRSAINHTIAGADSDTDALLRRALEIAYQRPLAAALAKKPFRMPIVTPAVQSVFCIDVRSEVIRRALERVAPRMTTIGFAGFFGLPISYTPLGTNATRPQLPGLLAPSMGVTETSGDAKKDADISKARRHYFASRQSLLAFQRLPGSAFTLVETLGLGFLGKLVGRSLASRAASSAPDQEGLSKQYSLRPGLIGRGVNSLHQQTSLAEAVLKAMGLTSDFARIVMLAGHGSQTANNPHAAGLDCGACCGQTGAINARTLAGLLNRQQVRQALAERAIRIPETTHFLAALHNTTTDEVELFDTDLVPPGHTGDLSRLRKALAEAGDLARAERAPALGLGQIQNQPAALLNAVKTRANDWAQTRPEWGLANNAAFIVAPRSRSQGIDLAGRSFLHDYEWRHDSDGSILELIMTAPMVVTHWINMQYFASTVDNVRYGSGNKVLHNVVGGRIGVFEGNGGDLRIGLPMQSLHDGVQWMHTPLRLSVFIEAPQASIEAVMDKHEVVRQLVHNRWLHLFRIDSSTNAVEQYRKATWTAFS
jgi:uncharacterized protein YbcC (UPF0753/DUF2309 family)